MRAASTKVGVSRAAAALPVGVPAVRDSLKVGARLVFAGPYDPAGVVP